MYNLQISSHQPPDAPFASIPVFGLLLVLLLVFCCLLEVGGWWLRAKHSLNLVLGNLFTFQYV